MDQLKQEKSRQDRELASLRSDYADISELLEENLHVKAKKDELDATIARKEGEHRKTLQRYANEVADLEEKVKEETDAKETLQASLNRLEESLNQTRDEKTKLSTELMKCRQQYEFTSSQLKELEEQQNVSMSVKAELNRKDKQIRDAVERYTKRIAELEAKLEEESQCKLELEGKLVNVRSELDNRQSQTHDVIQRQRNDITCLGLSFRVG